MTDEIVVILQRNRRLGADKTRISQIEHVGSISAAKEAQESGSRIGSKTILLHFVSGAAATVVGNLPTIAK